MPVKRDRALAGEAYHFVTRVHTLCAELPQCLYTAHVFAAMRRCSVHSIDLPDVVARTETCKLSQRFCSRFYCPCIRESWSHRTGSTSSGWMASEAMHAHGPKSARYCVCMRFCAARWAAQKNDRFFLGCVASVPPPIGIPSGLRGGRDSPKRHRLCGLLQM